MDKIGFARSTGYNVLDCVHVPWDCDRYNGAFSCYWRIIMDACSRMYYIRFFRICSGSGNTNEVDKS